MMDTLKWKRFLPAKAKVKCIEFHTIHPWLAIADKANKVSVWDFESEQVRPHSIPCTDHDAVPFALKPAFSIVYRHVRAAETPQAG
jgi:hypothetical protein